mmetsp:Transcript_23588/g.70899  ORF Transcript_23588/g.70899 Transcript_23588/m.70899 type:complete len:206 (+) Transcript_23588:2084-2701(+)
MARGRRRGRRRALDAAAVAGAHQTPGVRETHVKSDEATVASARADGPAGPGAAVAPADAAADAAAAAHEAPHGPPHGARLPGAAARDGGRVPGRRRGFVLELRRPVPAGRRLLQVEQRRVRHVQARGQLLLQEERRRHLYRRGGRADAPADAKAHDAGADAAAVNVATHGHLPAALPRARPTYADPTPGGRGLPRARGLVPRRRG